MISYAQNGEDVRLWHAFGSVSSVSGDSLTYVEVGANEPLTLSLTASLYELGWRGLLIEADPELAARLREARPGDVVVQAAAAAKTGTVTFYKVPGTGLGTMDPVEARAAKNRGFGIEEVVAPSFTLDEMLDAFTQQSGRSEIHALSIDVEGAELTVLRGLSLQRHRPWVLCIEAVEPGTSIPSHHKWEHHLSAAEYLEVAFDGINRWYVAKERAECPVFPGAGAIEGTSIANAIAIPMNALDAGAFGWVTEDLVNLAGSEQRMQQRLAWQHELITNDLVHRVPASEYERQIAELRTALASVEGSRTFALSKRIARLGKKGLHVFRKVRNALPRPLMNRLIKERHLRHVAANMRHLTDSAYLGHPPSDSVSWIASSQLAEGMPDVRPPLPPGLELGEFSSAQSVIDWIEAYPWDSDDQLNLRMDNHDDEVGRARAALRTRLRLAAVPTDPYRSNGNRVAIDARSLQSTAFGNRGIGRFARAVLLAAREAVEDVRITLIVDRGLQPLPKELAGACSQVTRITEAEVAEFSVFLQPSPMTHSADPVIPLLHSQAYTMAVVFDFIPLHYPTIYLKHAAARAEYGASLDALNFYKDFICISHVVKHELAMVLKRSHGGTRALQAVVAWPRDVLVKDSLHTRATTVSKDGPVVLMTGDEPRKNTFGGLAGIAAATSSEKSRDVVVVGLAGQGTKVHHWSIAAAMRPGEATTLGRVTDAELAEVLAAASCVVVPSFDEGLSLPVIEALCAGVPVVTSNIPSHRELVGRGSFSCDPASPRSIARAVSRVRGNRGIQRAQRRALARHKHATLEEIVVRKVLDNVRTAEGSQAPPTLERSKGERKLSVGVATPWTPQRTGVADFSTTVFTELARLVDLTVYTTSGATVNDVMHPDAGLRHRSIEEVFADPDLVAQRHDAFLAVIGNSHYHLPFVQALSLIDAMAIAHDARMVEFYLALRGRGGVEHLMLMTDDASAPRHIAPSLDDQIEDMRLLQNLGFWEIANRSTTLVSHSPTSGPRVARETSRAVYVLPFANQRVPATTEVTESERAGARARSGLGRYPEGTIHLASFGYVDPRTKMTDVVIEAAGWLTRWGYPIALHLVGSASERQHGELTQQARAAGVEDFQITGFQTEGEFRDWLLAINVGVQLRISSDLGVSGPLSDLAAFGTSAVASAGLCADVDTPPYITALPDVVSPVMLAEAVEGALSTPRDEELIEAQRLAYLARKSPEHYAQLLMELIEMS